MSLTNLRSRNIIPLQRNDVISPLLDVCKLDQPPVPSLQNVYTQNSNSTPLHNRSKTMECFRTDLITNMKLPDNTHLEPGSYVIIQDQWRHTWEKGVQVPTVLLDSLSSKSRKRGDTVSQNQLWPPPGYSSTSIRPKKYLRDHGLPITSSYSLDDLDASWLELVPRHYQLPKELPNHINANKALYSSLTPDTLRQSVILLEHAAYRNMAHAIRTQEELGIQYDDEVACDVCGELDASEENELVFCDNCNVCVHQLCYGVSTVPEGPWLCAPCLQTTLDSTKVSLSLPQPSCHLCPSPPGGALKPSLCGKYWVHVSCARWIPELGLTPRSKTRLACTKCSVAKQIDVSKINSSRWNLICSLCRVRKGACIQCSEPQCVTAFHTSCARKNSFEMFQAPSSQLQAFCPRHSSPHRSDRSAHAPTASKLVEMEQEFDTYADTSDLKQLQLSPEVAELVYNYWGMKRRANHCKPLVTESLQEVVKPHQMKFDSSQLKRSFSSYNTDASSSPPDSPPRKSREKARQTPSLPKDRVNEKKLYKLRLDLEKARNLSYMLCRREKIKRQLISASRACLERELLLLERSTEKDMTTPEEYKTRYTNESYTRAKRLGRVAAHSNES